MRLESLARHSTHDLAPFARDCGYDGPPFVWDEERRAGLRAELDGIYAHFYGLSRDDFAYILDTFPIVRRHDERAVGEYRTKHFCLEAYDYFALETLRALELRVPAIELALRKRIDEAAKGDVDSLPSPMQGKLRDTYAWHHPGFSGTPTLGELLSSTTMEDLEKLLRAEAIWPAFEPWGLSKGKFEDRLSDLHRFRNPMAHSRAMSEAVRTKGDAAVAWFDDRLGIG